MLLGSAVDIFIRRTGLESAFEKSDIGKAFKAAGIELSRLIGTLVTAFVVVLGFVVALQYVNIGGEAGSLLAQVASYLPRLIGGIVLLTAGIILVGLLVDYIGKLFIGLFPKQFAEIGEMLKNLLLIGLVALIISIALNIMLFTGYIVYPLILGAVVIGAGIFIGNAIVRSIVEEHPGFSNAAPYAKFMIYLIFIIVGLGALFANFPQTVQVVENIAWGVAIAVGILLVPVVYTLVKQVAQEQNRLNSRLSSCPLIATTPLQYASHARALKALGLK
jgi:hypothetical protein